jgi:hypothetical protein
MLCVWWCVCVQASTFLACSSCKGTIHIFSLVADKAAQVSTHTLTHTHHPSGPAKTCPPEQPRSLACVCLVSDADACGDAGRSCRVQGAAEKEAGAGGGEPRNTTSGSVGLAARNVRVVAASRLLIACGGWGLLSPSVSFAHSRARVTVVVVPVSVPQVLVHA